VREAAAAGLPIYAECGGLMLLSSGIWWQQRRYPMAGVLPLDVEVLPKPQGHGYTQLVVDARNPFFPEGTVLKGHEFHYSRVVAEGRALHTACAVVRGTGCLPGRDGLVFNETFASYTHLHALATPEWAAGLVTAARRFAASR
jgi:cobyrinic acid a,c-diamide synthase